MSYIQQVVPRDPAEAVEITPQFIADGCPIPTGTDQRIQAYADPLLQIVVLIDQHGRQATGRCGDWLVRTPYPYEDARGIRAAWRLCPADTFRAQYRPAEGGPR